MALLYQLASQQRRSEMKSKGAKVLITIGILLSIGLCAAGQQVSSMNSSIAQLKESISKLESVDRDSATPTEVKELNRAFLTEQRAQLRSLLQKRINALAAYRKTVGTSLSGEEDKVIENSIQELKSDLDKLENNLRNDTPATEFVAATTKETVNSGDRLAKPLALSASAPSSQQTATPAPAPGCNLYTRNPKLFSLVDQYTCNIVDSIKRRKVGDPTHSIPANPTAGLELDPDFTRLFIILSAKKGRATEFLTAEESRTDKQVGGDSSNAGSTSLVTKGNVPAILGFAVENGALEKDVTGTTITFRGNPVGILKALAGQGIIGGYDTDDATTRFLRRFSFGVSFDANRGAEPGVFTGGKQQISSISARAVLYDKRDPRRPEYKKDWEDFLGTAALGFLNDDSVARDHMLDTTTNPAIPTWTDPTLQAWYDDTQRALAAAKPEDVEATLIDRLNKLPLDNLAPETMTASANFENAFKLYVRGRDAILKKVGKAGVLTFDYVDDREVNAPDLSTFKLIGEKGFSNGRVDLTGNASISMFNRKPASASIGRVRDAQAALQLDGTFGSAESTGVFV
ncbi:MAG TPA: hypothetical protein VKB86_10235, partial [Pyrinomonadaceae bacterium]|nr:hypothetical protein [Pyrinomonadaceae bacterium]